MFLFEYGRDFVDLLERVGEEEETFIHRKSQIYAKALSLGDINQNKKASEGRIRCVFAHQMTLNMSSTDSQMNKIKILNEN